MNDPVLSVPAALTGRAGLALRLAAAVDTVGEAERSPGSGVEVATQYSGGKILGVALREDTITICVIAKTFQVRAVVDRVHEVSRAVLDTAQDTRHVAVVVADLVVPGAS